MCMRGSMRESRVRLYSHVPVYVRLSVRNRVYTQVGQCVCICVYIYAHILSCVTLLPIYSPFVLLFFLPPSPSPSFVLFCFLRSSKWLSCCCLYVARVSVTAIRLLVVLVLCRWTNGSWCCYCFHVGVFFGTLSNWVLIWEWLIRFCYCFPPSISYGYWGYATDDGPISFLVYQNLFIRDLMLFSGRSEVPPKKTREALMMSQ